MRLLAGARILDRYLVDAFLDEGGMGQVYRGHHASLGFLVAVKVLGDQSPETMKRFEREARLMARVRHPNVVSVLDFGLVGAELPAEFFAVASEAFFETPALLNSEYPEVYAQLRSFYSQDPLLRRAAG